MLVRLLPDQSSKVDGQRLKVKGQKLFLANIVMKVKTVSLVIFRLSIHTLTPNRPSVYPYLNSEK
jgi:hypothetical protein